MKKVYSYKGQINQDLISIDTANIKVFEYIQSIDTSVISEKEQELLSRLTISIAMNGAVESTTFSDVRFCYLFVNMMLKNNDRIKVSTIQDFIIYYQYLLAFYNKAIEDIDNMIRFVNLYIGYTFQNDKVSKAEIKELSNLAAELINAMDDGKTIGEYTPAFIREAISMADGITTEEWQDEVSKEDIEIEPKQPVEEVVDQVETITDEEKVQEWTEVIEGLSMLLETATDKEKIEEWQEVIEGLSMLIEQKTGKPFQIMEIGGVVQSYVSPALLQFDSGGIVNRFSSPLPQTPAFGGTPRMFKKGGKIGFQGLAKKVAAAYKGKNVKPKYRKEYGTTYSAAEAKEVGNKIAAKVYRLQQGKKAKA